MIGESAWYHGHPPWRCRAAEVITMAVRESAQYRCGQVWLIVRRNSNRCCTSMLANAPKAPALHEWRQAMHELRQHR
jgi:hypothetical protein